MLNYYKSLYQQLKKVDQNKIENLFSDFDNLITKKKGKKSFDESNENFIKILKEIASRNNIRQEVDNKSLVENIDYNFFKLQLSVGLESTMMTASFIFEFENNDAIHLDRYINPDESQSQYIISFLLNKQTDINQSGVYIVVDNEGEIIYSKENLEYIKESTATIFNSNFINTIISNQYKKEDLKEILYLQKDIETNEDVLANRIINNLYLLFSNLETRNKIKPTL